MLLSLRSTSSISAFISIIWIQILETRKYEAQLCPLGFELANDRNIGNICYKQKEKEIFANLHDNCDGNFYTIKLYLSLNISNIDGLDLMWTEYKSAYPGGPFISTSCANNDETVVINVTYSAGFDIYQESCLILDKFGQFTAVHCDEKFIRYCIIKAYSEIEDKTIGSVNVSQSRRFFGPREICLTNAASKNENVTTGMTWTESREFCMKNGGSLLNRGWVYSNSPWFYKTGALPVQFLETTWHTDRQILLSTFGEKFNEVNNKRLSIVDDNMVMVIKNRTLEIVKSSFIFNEVVCEHFVDRKNVLMRLIIETNELLLIVNNSVDIHSLHCYTNSYTYYPTRVEINERKSYDNDFDVFKLSAKNDGYYWCIHVDINSLHEIKSGKIVFIGNKELLKHRYAIKIRLYNEYSFDNIKVTKEYWKEKLGMYIFYWTKYLKTNSTDKLFNTNIREDFEVFMNVESIQNDAYNGTIKEIMTKRLYMDKRTILFHVQIREDVVPIIPMRVRDADLIFMKPVFYCNRRYTDLMHLRNSSSTALDSGAYKCVGNFDEGVSLGAEGIPDCMVGSEITNEFTDIGFNNTIAMSATDTTKITLSVESDNITISLEDIQGSSEEIVVKNITCPTVVVDKDKTYTSNATNNNTTIESVINSTNLLKTASTIRPLSELEHQLQLVLKELESLLQNDSVITLKNIEDAFDQVNEVLGIEEDIYIPTNLLRILDILGSRVDLNGTETGGTVRDNIALMLADIGPDYPIRGMRLANSTINSYNDEIFEFLVGDVETTSLLAKECDALVYLPKSVYKLERRVSFIVFRNGRAFHSDKSNVVINSKVISVNIENITAFEDGEVIDIHLRPFVAHPGRNVRRRCVYWKFSGNKTGHWATDGCTFIRSTDPGTLDTCRCNHLTHFAEILVPRSVFSENNENVLKVVSSIGCSFSVFGVTIIILTAAMFRAWRKEFSNKIWLQLCIALLLLKLCFLIVVFAEFDGTEVSCMIVGIAMHYSTLATFCWMLVAAIVSYRRIVLVFTKEVGRRFLRASVFAWGIPMVIVSILFLIDHHSYTAAFDDKTFCYPSEYGLWFAVYAPISIMLVANWIIFIMVIHSLFLSRKSPSQGNSNNFLRIGCIICLLVFLYGLPWILGFFAYYTAIAYMFCFTITFQGFVLFMFTILGNKQTRSLWLSKLGIKRNNTIPMAYLHSDRSLDE